MSQPATPDYAALAQAIKQWGRELGFQQVCIADTELGEHERHLLNWLDRGRDGTNRSRPAELFLIPVSVISGESHYASRNR